MHHIVVGFFKEILTAGIDKLCSSIGFVFRQHQNIHRNGGVEEQVRRQGDHRFHIQLLSTTLTDFSQRHHDRRCQGSRRWQHGPYWISSLMYAIQRQSRLLDLALYACWRKAFIADKSWVITTNPLNRIRWVRNDGIKSSLFISPKCGSARGLPNCILNLS